MIFCINNTLRPGSAFAFLLDRKTHLKHTGKVVCTINIRFTANICGAFFNITINTNYVVYRYG
jgi:hypothetical protein